jgi:hypothetical protein
MWTVVLLSSVVLTEMHWAAAIGTVGLAAVGTVAILYGVRTTCRTTCFSSSRES